MRFITMKCEADNYTIIFEVMKVDASTLELRLINDDGDIVSEQVKMILNK